MTFPNHLRNTSKQHCTLVTNFLKCFIVLGSQEAAAGYYHTGVCLNLLTSTPPKDKEAAIYEDDSTPYLEELGTTFTDAPFLHFLHRLSQVHAKEGFKSGFGCRAGAEMLLT